MERLKIGDLTIVVNTITMDVLEEMWIVGVLQNKVQTNVDINNNSEPARCLCM